MLRQADGILLSDPRKLVLFFPKNIQKIPKELPDEFPFSLQEMVWWITLASLLLLWAKACEVYPPVKIWQISPLCACLMTVQMEVGPGASLSPLHPPRQAVAPSFKKSWQMLSLIQILMAEKEIWRIRMVKKVGKEEFDLDPSQALPRTALQRCRFEVWLAKWTNAILHDVGARWQLVKFAQ